MNFSYRNIVLQVTIRAHGHGLGRAKAAGTGLLARIEQAGPGRDPTTSPSTFVVAAMHSHCLKSGPNSALRHCISVYYEDGRATTTTSEHANLVHLAKL